jgi:uncharacterized protein (UPF0262 family)
VAEATLAELRIDEATWSAGSPERRHEWRLAASEVVQEGVFELSQAVAAGGKLKGELSILGGEGDGGRVRFEISVEDEGEHAGHHVEARPARAIARDELLLEQIQPLADEYMRVCMEMGKLGEGAGSPKLEALDIAKRLVHDEAGETVRTLLSGFRPDHATARRLFTLLVTLLYDTTRLAAPPHPVRS